MPHGARGTQTAWSGAAIVRATAVLLLAGAISANAVGTSPVPAQAGEDERAQQALERGFWIIRPGDSMLRIARRFAADERDAHQLVREFAALNDHAIMGNGAAKLVVGARLTLPPRVRAMAEPGSQKREIDAPGPALARAAAPRAVVPGVPPIAANAPEPVQPAPVPSPEYVDRVLPGGGDERELGLDDRPRDGSPGLVQYAAELRSERRRNSASGTTQADGVGLRFAMETERFGDFTALGQLTHFSAPRGDPGGDRTRATGTLLHENFALGGDYVANSAAGVIRPLFPIWLTSSYRVTFAPSLLAGVQTAITSPVSDLRIGAGRIGQLAGLGIQQFERTSGEQVVGAYTHRLGPDWTAGGAAIAVRGSSTIREHGAATVGISRDLGPTGPAFKIQVASTDDGERAAWFDAQARSGRLLQRFGAYHADPDFIFGESAAARDVRGAYWRGEYRAAGNFYSFGVEGAQDNLKRDPARGGNDSVGGYGNVTLRVDRTLQVGGGVSVRHEDPRVERGAVRDVGYANAFVSKSWIGGVTRLDANLNTNRPRGSASERTATVGWNQDWPRIGPVDLTTLLSQSDERLTDAKVRRRLASVQARGPIYGSLRWDAALTFVDIDDPRGSERNYNASLGLDWNPVPHWTFQLLWFRNRIQPGPDNALSPFIRDDSLQLNARYEDSSGTPYPRVAGGRSGSGRVLGSVFFDENSDGTRQANERGAPGVQVVLDERLSAVTDNDGRFQFALVPSGNHRIRILVERLPLPWGLLDDAPRELRVDVRGESRMDFGLTRIGP